MKSNRKHEMEASHPDTRGCSCDECVGACRTSPGWFAPGEAEKAAELLGMDFEDFKKFLIIDYWVDGANLYAPRKVGVEVDSEVASWGYAFLRARCIFLGSDNRCLIYRERPRECRATLPCDPKQRSIRYEIQSAWGRAGDPLARKEGGNR